MFAIGNKIRFDYPSKEGGMSLRQGRIEEVKRTHSLERGVEVLWVRVWDYTVENYRTFIIDKMMNLTSVG